MPIDTVFRPFQPSDAERSDRAAGDRARHREKVRQAIRDNIADIIAEESIIGKSGDRIIKVPIRGVKEFRFVFGNGGSGVGQGDGSAEPGQVIGKGDGNGDAPADRAGNRPGVDYYETDVTLDELIELMFEDQGLPDLERKRMREIPSLRMTRRRGYRRAGIRVRLDKKRTVRAKLRRRLATANGGDGDETDENDRQRFPFHSGDLTYRHIVTDIREESNAAVFCIMDTSGSMDRMKKYLARSFFFLLYQFIQTKYRNVEIVFIAHHATAKEVDEDEFFHKGESGGTMVSSGYQRTLEIIHERYHPSLWNLYAFHCSDGDNFDTDNAAAMQAAKELTELCHLFGYGEIKPIGSRHYEGSMLNTFRRLEADNFQTVLIKRKEDVWPSFKSLLAKDRGRDADS